MKRTTTGISTVLAIAFVFSLLLSALAPVSAQTYSEQVSRKVQEDIKLTRQVIQAKRKAIVALNLGLTDYESKAFWPVYDEYWSERKKLADRHITLLSDFAKNYVYSSLTNDRAEELLKDWLSVEQKKLKLQKKFIKKFKKAIPAKKVLRYFQIENKLNLVIDTELSSQIPLAR